MSLKNPKDNTDTANLSELRMAVMYGAEGLKRCTNTDEYDVWLSLFEAGLEELESPSPEGSGNFPLKEAAISDEEKREAVVEKMEELSTFATELRSVDLPARSEYQQEISEHVKVAEILYDQLGDIEDENEKSLGIH